MQILKNGWQLRIWRHVALAALLCTIVIMLNIVVGVVAFKLFYSFWFGVALYVFTPVWLVCYGLFFSSRWRWHELALGVALAIFLVNMTYMHDSTDTHYKWLSSVAFALIGTSAMSVGFATAALGRSLRKIRPFHSKSHLKG